VNDSASSIIELRDVLVSAGGRLLLELDGLRVTDGEALAILGRNGAGKTTLLETLCGLRRPTRGELHVLDQPLHEMGSFALTRLRRQIGFLPQRLAVAGDLPLTTREVVAIGRSGWRGLMRPLQREDWSLVDEWIDRLGLAGCRRQPYATLSGGEQRRALLARVMVQQPKLLLLDEPAANLDLSAREQVVQIIDELHAIGGLTLLLVCHELETIPACCGRMIVLDDGRVVGDGPPGDLLDAERVRLLYGNGVSIERRGERWLAVPSGWIAQDAAAPASGGGDRA
jgi:ABC-type cobalamin/Fe3+-siderophores transport system ATPase subunit